ncbi:branched-chain amino acid ABC transporter permease [Mesorhizobium sp. M7A.F.Ca.US.006.01.1.1]|nr:branched-chain amino acid ABC transporter permease [Mesorhizobium sp. M7A.F.Ca.US.006.01.1.1]
MLNFSAAGCAGACATIATLLAITLVLPAVLNPFSLLQATLLFVVAIYGLSQGFIWGFGGILCFGQASFFGLGAYAYAISAINIGESTVPLMLAIIVPMLFATLLGYFMFYGRVSDVYVGVITLTVSIILFQLVNATSGNQYRIGRVAMGGFNGIPAVPPLNVPGFKGWQFDTTGVWYLTMAALIGCYALLRFILAVRLGRVIVAIRENETRAELVGYDPRFYKLTAFVIGAGVAGLAGCLYVNWAGFISPAVFALTMSALALISVLAGGLGTLAGPIFGAVLIQGIVNSMGDQRLLDPSLATGLLLILFVLVVPKGLLPTAGLVLTRISEILQRPETLDQQRSHSDTDSGRGKRP